MACSKVKMDAQRIQAFIRIRPFNSQELECHGKTCIQLTGNDIVVNMDDENREFTFERIFDSNSKQKHVYMDIIKSLIPDVIQGYNATVLACGGIGSGKTYTVIGTPTLRGSNYLEQSDAGIIPRTLGHLFKALDSNAELDLAIRVSYFEIFNEVLIDLVSSQDNTLKIFEDKNKGSVQVYGLEEVTVYNKDQVYEVLQRGADKRQKASHAVFTVAVHSRETTPEGDEFVKTGKINIVELAGIQTVQRSGAMDKSAREESNIDQSLLTLDRVIKALIEKSSYIPYRESKLTRILQDSLGGRSMTAIIATISPSADHMEDTINTLDYAHRVGSITNFPAVNQRISKTYQVKEYIEQLKRLENDVVAARSQETIYLNPFLLESQKREEELLKSIAQCFSFELRIQELHFKKIQLEEVYFILNTELEAVAGNFFKLRHNVYTLREERQITHELIDSFEQAQTKLSDDNRSLANNLKYYLSQHRELKTKLDNQDDTNVMIDHVRELQNNVNTCCEITSKECLYFSNSVNEKAQWINNDMTEGFYASEDLIENANPVIQDIQTSFMSTMLDTLSAIEELNKKQLQSICHDIKKHKDVAVRLDLTFRLTNLMIIDHFMRMIEKFELCRKQNAIILSSSKMAREAQSRITRRIESISHEVNTLATMTKKTAEVISTKFEMLSVETDKVESELENAIEQPLVSKRVLQEYNTKLADNCKVIKVLMEANVSSIAHAITKCENMQTVLDDGTNIICDNATVVTRKMEHIISELVAINESDEAKYREAERLINRTKTLQYFKKSLQRQLKYPIYSETDRDTILRALNILINNHDNMTSDLAEKLNAHDISTVMSSSHAFSVLDGLDKETASHTCLIVKDIKDIKETVDKYVDGLKPSIETPGCSGVKHIPHHRASLDMGGDAVSTDDSDA